MSVVEKKCEESTGKKGKEVFIGTPIIDVINESIQKNKTFFSFEFFPPKTDKGRTNLAKKLFRLQKLGPKWMDVTWGALGKTSDLTPKICDFIQNTVKGNCLMHLTCTNSKKSTIDNALKTAKENGLRNILALRGDPPEGQKQWKSIDGGFCCARDLVKYIKEKYGNWFGITVAGYPEGHPIIRKRITNPKWNPITNKPRYWAIRKLEENVYEGVSMDDFYEELKYLKSKIDAGATVIITQLFYDFNIFIEWCKEVRNIGISVPILPGIMPLRIGRTTGMYKICVPNELKKGLALYANDEKKRFEFGLNFVQKMCDTILNATYIDKNGKKLKLIHGLHIYTMNLERATLHLLNKMKMGNEELIKSEIKRVDTNYEEKLKEKLKKMKIQIEMKEKRLSVKEMTSF